MKALLITPDDRMQVTQLTRFQPLAAINFLGKPFLHYWIEYLVEAGATEIKILSSDRPEQVRSIVGDGCQWGVRITLFPQSHELTPAEARAKYRLPKPDGWMNESCDIS